MWIYLYYTLAAVGAFVLIWGSPVPAAVVLYWLTTDDDGDFTN